MRIRVKAGLVAMSVLALVLSGCGSDSLGGGEPEGSAAPASEVSVNKELAAKLPEKIKKSGTIVVGTDATYAPNEFLDADGKTVVGMDVDLFNAVAAKLGVKVEWKPSSFSTIIVGVQSGKYDVGVSSFTINDKRKKQVNMVSYYSAGTQWAAPKGNPKKVDPDNACGKNIAVQDGTTQLQQDLPVRQKKCEGNKIKVLPYEGQDQASSAVISGRADAMLADSPVIAYAVTTSKGKIEPLGDIYDAAPYGYVINKDETDFADAVAGALKEIEADGSYKSALAKWKLEAGAIDDFAVNP